MATTVRLTQVKETIAAGFRTTSTCSLPVGAGFDEYLFLLDVTGAFVRVCEVGDIVTYPTAPGGSYYRVSSITRDFDELDAAVAEATTHAAAIETLVDDWDVYYNSFVGVDTNLVTAGIVSVQLVQTKSVVVDAPITTPPNYSYRLSNVCSLASPDIADSFNDSVFLFRERDDEYMHVCNAADMERYLTSKADALANGDDYYRLDTIVIDYADVDTAVASTSLILTKLGYMVTDWEASEDAYTGTVVTDAIS